jgi:hypothetical protein
MLSTRNQISSLDLKELFEDDSAKNVIWQIVMDALNDRLLLLGLVQSDLKNFTTRYYHQYLCDIIKNKNLCFKEDVHPRQINTIIKSIAALICDQMHALTDVDIAQVHNDMAMRAGITYSLLRWIPELNIYASNTRQLLKNSRSTLIVQHKVNHAWQDYLNYLYKICFMQLLSLAGVFFMGAEALVITGCHAKNQENCRPDIYLKLALFSATVIALLYVGSRNQFIQIHGGFLRPRRLQEFLLHSARKALINKRSPATHFITDMIKEYPLRPPLPQTTISAAPDNQPTAVAIRMPERSPRHIVLGADLATTPPLNLAARRNSAPEMKEPVTDTAGNFYLKLSNGSFFRMNPNEVNAQAGTNARRNSYHPEIDNSLSGRLMNIWKNSQGQIRAPATKTECIKFFGKHEKVNNRELDPKQHLKVRIDGSPFGGLRIVLHKRPAIKAETDLLHGATAVEIYSPKKFTHK